MRRIQASDYIQHGFFSEDAQILQPIIDTALATGEEVEVDFQDVKYFTTSFIGGTVAGSQDKITITNMSETGKAILGLYQRPQ